MLTAYYIAAYSSTKRVLVIRKNLQILLYTFPIFSFTLFCTNLQEHRALLPYVQCLQIVSDTR